MGKKQQLKQSIYVMLEHNRNGAYETQRIRRKALFVYLICIIIKFVFSNKFFNRFV
jgi:hypothetical protein